MFVYLDTVKFMQAIDKLRGKYVQFKISPGFLILETKSNNLRLPFVKECGLKDSFILNLKELKDKLDCMNWIGEISLYVSLFFKEGYLKVSNGKQSFILRIEKDKCSRCGLYKELKEFARKDFEARICRTCAKKEINLNKKKGVRVKKEKRKYNLSDLKAERDYRFENNLKKWFGGIKK